MQPSSKVCICFKTRELEPNRKLSPDHLLSILALVGAGSPCGLKHATKLEKKVMLRELEPAIITRCATKFRL
jgi:hypothetical protein